MTLSLEKAKVLVAQLTVDEKTRLFNFLAKNLSQSDNGIEKTPNVFYLILQIAIHQKAIRHIILTLIRSVTKIHWKNRHHKHTFSTWQFQRIKFSI